ncbi:MAG TPA: Lpg1974 family pore-forming outer membrane protein [Planctomycetaceae bacterium]|nr:Lpg1974 family pore-forming outer membrane protein [Planctomycetaceae bacterium]
MPISARPNAVAWAPPRDEAAALPVVALPAELFAPISASGERPIVLASLAAARPGVIETALVVPAAAAESAPAEQGPMLIPASAEPEFDEPFSADGTPATQTVSAQAVTVVENPSTADHTGAFGPTIAFQQPGPTFVQPGPTIVAPAQPPGGMPGGPAVIAPGAPILMPPGGMPYPGGAPFAGGPCGTCGPCPPWVECGPCGPCDPCGFACDAVCARAGITVFGEFLFLTARGADVPFATPVDGLGINAVPIGNTRVSDPAYDPGFRVGGSYALSPRTSFVLMYTDYESSVNDLATLPGGTGFLRATLVHPNTTNVATDSLSAEADYDIDFQFGDLGLSHDLWRDCESRLTGIAGFRYARLDQDLKATYSILGVTTVDSKIDFEGLGPRLGLESERFLRPRLSVYGNVFANFLAGSFDGSYVQRNINAPGAPQAAAGIEDDRIVTLLEGEVGIAWCPPCGGWRASVGYYVAGWFNVVTTSEFIKAVQADDFSDVDDTLTFDGLTARLQFEF